MKRSLAIFSTIICIFAGSTAYAEGFGIGANISTLGPGVEATFKLAPFVNLRAGVHGMTYSASIEPEDIKYDLELDNMNELLLLDIHPLNGGLRISAGAVFNQTSLDLNGQLNVLYRLGANYYTPQEIGVIQGKVDFKPVAPYVGIGWGNASKDQLLADLGLQVDLGVIMQAEADVELTATGLLALNPTLLMQLEREKKELQDALNRYQYYPVVTLGITYSF